MRHVSLLCVLLPLFAVGCSTTGPMDETVTGAVPGPAVRPAQSADLFIGPIAERMDERARADYLIAQTSALDGGTRTEFDNSTIGGFGSVTVFPSALGSANAGVECRKYSTVLWVLGSGRAIEGDSCREHGGPWRAMGYVAH